MFLNLVIYEINGIGIGGLTRIIDESLRLYGYKNENDEYDFRLCQ